jgi:hypothetical protein
MKPLSSATITVENTSTRQKETPPRPVQQPTQLYATETGQPGQYQPNQAPSSNTIDQRPVDNEQHYGNNFSGPNYADDTVWGGHQQFPHNTQPSPYAAQQPQYNFDPPGYEMKPPSYRTPQTPYVVAPPPYDMQPPPFGMDQLQYETQRYGYGMQPSWNGMQQPPYGMAPHSYGMVTVPPQHYGIVAIPPPGPYEMQGLPSYGMQGPQSYGMQPPPQSGMQGQPSFGIQPTPQYGIQPTPSQYGMQGFQQYYPQTPQSYPMQHEEHFDEQPYYPLNNQGVQNGQSAAIKQGQYTHSQNQVSNANNTNRIQNPILADHVPTDHSVESRFRFHEMERGMTLAHLENLKHMQSLLDLHDTE